MIRLSLKPQYPKFTTAYAPIGENTPPTTNFNGGRQVGHVDASFATVSLMVRRCRRKTTVSCEREHAFRRSANRLRSDRPTEVDLCDAHRCCCPIDGATMDSSLPAASICACVGRPDRSELRRMDDECLVDRPAVSFCIREGSSTAGAVAVDTPGKAHECRRLGHCHDRFESQWVAMRIVAIGDSTD